MLSPRISLILVASPKIRTIPKIYFPQKCGSIPGFFRLHTFGSLVLSVHAIKVLVDLVTGINTTCWGQSIAPTNRYCHPSGVIYVHCTLWKSTGRHYHPWEKHLRVILGRATTEFIFLFNAANQLTLPRQFNCKLFAGCSLLHFTLIAANVLCLSQLWLMWMWTP